MTGAEYIAAFLEKQNCNNIFLVTGGACAFIVDAISRNPSLRYIPMQHEQSAAMAADVTHNSLARDTFLESTEINYNGEGDQPVVVMEMTFSIIYLTTEAAPDSAL